MTQQEGERRVRAIQAEFLRWIEGHEVLQHLPSEDFQDIRKRVFRSTYFAFRLGVVGLSEQEGEDLFQQFFGWMRWHPALIACVPTAVSEIAERAFRNSLEAFRLGAIVSQSRHAVQHG